MKYLKTYENHTLNKYIFDIGQLRHDLLIVDDDELATYKYDKNDEYELSGPLSIDEYVKEKIANKKCDFYCNSCWTNHTGTIVDLKIFDPASYSNEDRGGPWLKVKFTEFGSDKKVITPDRNTEYEEWHDVDPYSQITVYGKQSDLSNKHDKIRQEIAEQKDTLQKYNL